MGRLLTNETGRENAKSLYSDLARRSTPTAYGREHEALAEEPGTTTTGQHMAISPNLGKGIYITHSSTTTSGSTRRQRVHAENLVHGMETKCYILLWKQLQINSSQHSHH
eukprot:4201355-Amphidinium_carterae.3